MSHPATIRKPSKLIASTCSRCSSAPVFRSVAIAGLELGSSTVERSLASSWKTARLAWRSCSLGEGATRDQRGLLSRSSESAYAVHLSSSSVLGVVMQHVEVKAKSFSPESGVVGSPKTTHAGSSRRAAHVARLYVKWLANAARPNPRRRGVEPLSSSSSDTSLRSAEAGHAVSTGEEAAKGQTHTSKQCKHSLPEPARSPVVRPCAQTSASTRFFVVRVAAAPLPTALNRAHCHTSERYSYDRFDRAVARALRPTCVSPSPASRRSSSPSRHQHYISTSQQGRTAVSSKKFPKILSWSVSRISPLWGPKRMIPSPTRPL